MFYYDTIKRTSCAHGKNKDTQRMSGDSKKCCHVNKIAILPLRVFSLIKTHSIEERKKSRSPS